MTDLPASVIKFPKPGHASYQEALRAQRDCQREPFIDPDEAVMTEVRKLVDKVVGLIGIDQAKAVLPNRLAFALMLEAVGRKP